MTKKQFDCLMIGDKVRKRNEDDILTVVGIKIENTYNEEHIKIIGKTINGVIKTGGYKNFVIPNKFIKINKKDGTKTEVSYSEIQDDELYGFYMNGSIKEHLMNGGKVFSHNSIYRYE